ncbi:MAG: hypothetical protein HY698_09115 [Deltaproteobacteria bacterium]|nr:hypothetical protein [Deltaproteobacteria bacterium]
MRSKQLLALLVTVVAWASGCARTCAKRQEPAAGAVNQGDATSIQAARDEDDARIPPHEVERVRGVLAPAPERTNMATDARVTDAASGEPPPEELPFPRDVPPEREEQPSGEERLEDVPPPDAGMDRTLDAGILPPPVDDAGPDLDAIAEPSPIPVGDAGT